MSNNLIEFDITSYNELSYSTGKLFDGAFAPNRVIWEKNNREAKKSEKQKYHEFEGKVIETAVLYPDEFDGIYKLDDTGINPTTKAYEFAKAYHIGRTEKKWGENRAVIVAQRFSRIQTPSKLSTLLDKVQSEYQPFIQHFQDYKGLTPISPELYHMAMRHRDRVYDDHNELKDILTDSRVQKEPLLNWENEWTHVKCKGYPDVSIPGEVKVDLKTTRNASKDQFARRYGDMHKFNYIPQLAAYNEADKNGQDQLCFVYAMEKHPLANWNMFKVSDWDLLEGKSIFSKWCAAFRFCKEHNLWHMGYEFSAMYQFEDDAFTYKKKSASAIVETDIY